MRKIYLPFINEDGKFEQLPSIGNTPDDLKKQLDYNVISKILHVIHNEEFSFSGRA